METKSTVLIADDDFHSREALKVLLSHENYNISLAKNGQEALALANTSSPDMILLDVMMPDMNGFEVCQALRAIPNLADIPILFITALDDRESRLEGIKRGGDDFITKPFDSMELKLRLQNIAKLNRYRRLLGEQTKFKWVLNNAEDGYLILDDQDQIQYANAQARLYLGLPETEAAPISQPFLTLAKSQYQCEPAGAWENWTLETQIQSKTDRAARYLVRTETQTANSFWLQVDILEVEMGASSSSTSGIERLIQLRDISQTVTKERLMWTFTSQVNHKLRAPLSLLSGYLALLEENHPFYSKDEYQFFLATAHRQAQALSQQIQDILEYLDTLENKEDFQGQCGLVDIVELLAKLSAKSNLKSINVTYENIDNIHKCQANLSYETMELILWELFENAKKFHPHHTPTLTIKMSKFQNLLRLEVGDDGQALSPAQLAQIWTPYYQAEKKFSGKKPGLGLGLSKVAAVLWDSGGTCRARNQKTGQGIVIELDLPLATDTTRRKNQIRLDQFEALSEIVAVNAASAEKD